MLNLLTMNKADIQQRIQAFRKERHFGGILSELKNDSAFRNGLLHEMEEKEHPFPEYASWIAQHFFKQYPEYLPERIPFIRKVLMETTNHSVQRNVTHMFLNEPLPVSDDGELLNLFLSFLESPEALPALKYSAFRSIEKQYFDKYPELIPEVGHLLFLHKEDTRPSIQSLRRYFNKHYKSFAGHD